MKRSNVARSKIPSHARAFTECQNLYPNSVEKIVSQTVVALNGAVKRCNVDIESDKMDRAIDKYKLTPSAMWASKAVLTVTR